MGRACVPWAVCIDVADGEPPGVIDYFRVESSAEHAADLLNRGLAQVEPHRALGCRVQPLAA